jgi:hypothetical protein
MYFLNASGTLCHVIEDLRTGEAPAPCGTKAHKLDIRHYQEGKTHKLLTEKPRHIPLCKHCEKGLAWVREV